MTKVFLFSGQGNQSSQMLRPIRSYQTPEAMEVFQEASEICGFSIQDLIEHSPAEVLSRTEYTQILIFATDMAYFKVLEGLGIRPDAAAGHSIGEYAALTAAGVLRFEDACVLVRERARLMSQVKTQGGLCALKSKEIDRELLQQICADIRRQGEYVAPALYNSRDQVVVGGTPGGLDAFCEAAKARPAWFTKRLAVGQAFHTELMRPMAEEFGKFVEKAQIHPPKIPVVLNCTGRYYEEKRQGEDLKEELIGQCCRPVMWETTMETLLRLPKPWFLESGPGHSLAALMKSWGEKAPCLCAEDRKGILTRGKELMEHVETV